MTTFYVHLVPYDRTYRLDRGQFTSLFPESMLTQALNDPDVTTIDLKESVVTPAGMTFLTRMVNRGSIPRQILPIEDLTRMYRYLLIDVLKVIVQPQYTPFSLTVSTNLLSLEDLNRDYVSLIAHSLRGYWPELCQYVFQRTDPEMHREDDQVVLALAAVHGDSSIFKSMRDRGIEIPLVCKNKVLTTECKRLHQAYRPNEAIEDFYLQRPLIYAALGQNAEIFRDIYSSMFSHLKPRYIHNLFRTVILYDNVDHFATMWNHSEVIEHNIDLDSIVRYVLTYSASRILSYILRYQLFPLGMIHNGFVDDDGEYNPLLMNRIFEHPKLKDVDPYHWGLFELHRDVYEGNIEVSRILGLNQYEAVVNLYIALVRRNPKVVSVILMNPNLASEDINGALDSLQGKIDSETLTVVLQDPRATR